MVPARGGITAAWLRLATSQGCSWGTVWGQQATAEQGSERGHSIGWHSSNLFLFSLSESSVFLFFFSLFSFIILFIYPPFFFLLLPSILIFFLDLSFSSPFFSSFQLLTHLFH